MLCPGCAKREAVAEVGLCAECAPAEGQRLLQALRDERQQARERMEDLDQRRRRLLASLLEAGVSQAQLARWEGVTPWAVGQAIKKGEAVRASA